MTDWLAFPETHMAHRAPVIATTAVRVWLWSLAGTVLLLVMVGGVTRLTWSGLSITEWRPVTGVLPPLSHAQWLTEFERYKVIPQYRELFPDMDLAAFQYIYFWEWAHRLIARLLGLAIVVPLAGFWATGRLPSRLRAPLVGLVALVGVQGAVGWWMVASGLAARTEVAQERLAIHLLLASATLASIVWLAAGESRAQRIRDLRHGDLLRDQAAAIAQPCRSIGLQTRRIDVGGHVGERRLSQLQIGKRLAEHRPCHRIGLCLIERALRKP